MEENKTKEKTETLQKKIITEVENSIETLLNQGITVDNVETLSELVDIHKDIITEREEKKNMNYENYGNYGNYSGRGPSRGAYGDNYGRYEGNYGRRGYDMKYRGHDHIDRVGNEYGRYMENRERYGAGNPESDKSFHYMVKALEDFIQVLHEEAETPQQKQMLNEAMQKSMR